MPTGNVVCHLAAHSLVHERLGGIGTKNTAEAEHGVFTVPRAQEPNAAVGRHGLQSGLASPHPHSHTDIQLPILARLHAQVVRAAFSQNKKAALGNSAGNRRKTRGPALGRK
jgi:hypothetical protein